MKHKAAYVPIQLWAIVVVILLSVLFFMENTYQKEKYNFFYQSTIFKKSLLMERLQEKTNNKRVVVFGSSLVRYGLPYDGRMNELLKRQHLPINYTRISVSGGEKTTSAFETVLNDILESPPDYLFIEAESFFFRANCELEGANLYNYLIQTCAQAIGTRSRFLIAKYILFQKQDVALLSMPTQGDVASQMGQVGDVALINDQRCTPKVFLPKFTKNIEQFLMEASSRGIKVVLLEMGRSKEAGEKMGLTIRSNLSETLDSVSQFYKIPYWHFPVQLSASRYYRDRAHLNELGREIFTKWFIQQIKTELENEPI